jgi:hypothetical protein
MSIAESSSVVVASERNDVPPKITHPTEAMVVGFLSQEGRGILAEEAD